MFCGSVSVCLSLSPSLPPSLSHTHARTHTQTHTNTHTPPIFHAREEAMGECNEEPGRCHWSIDGVRRNDRLTDHADEMDASRLGHTDIHQRSALSESSPLSGVSDTQTSTLGLVRIISLFRCLGHTDIHQR